MAVTASVRQEQKVKRAVAMAVTVSMPKEQLLGGGGQPSSVQMSLRPLLKWSVQPGTPALATLTVDEGRGDGGRLGSSARQLRRVALGRHYRSSPRNARGCSGWGAECRQRAAPKVQQVQKPKMPAGKTRRACLPHRQPSI